MTQVGCPAVGDRVKSVRKRKAHKKSRYGCRNCKLRRVKCCETQPACHQCLRFGVACNYNPSIPDLQPCSGASKVVQLNTFVDMSPLQTTKPVLDMINRSLQRNSPGLSGRTASRRFDNTDLARLDKFQMRTILTIGVKRVASVFQKEILHLACSHRFLMHLVQAVTASHDRYLCGAATARPDTVEAYHMTQALAAFRTLLSRPVLADERDALMGAASLLGVVSFFHLEATSVEEVWPLVDCDMSWLNLSDGKKSVWRIARPLAPESVFRRVTEFYERAEDEPSSHIPEPSTPSVFDHLFKGGPPSPSTATNPYYRTSRAIVNLLDKECGDETWLEFLSFLCYVDPPFKLLLQRKRPWALLILCYWYMKVCRGAWWISSRSIVQGQAICLYLERYHSHDSALQAALVKPRLEFEAAQMDGWGGVSREVIGSSSACNPLLGVPVY
jgi:hypothetical protein